MHRILASAARPTPRPSAKPRQHQTLGEGVNRLLSRRQPEAWQVRAKARPQDQPRADHRMIILAGSHLRKPPDHPPLQRPAGGRLTYWRQPWAHLRNPQSAQARSHHPDSFKSHRSARRRPRAASASQRRQAYVAGARQGPGSPRLRPGCRRCQLRGRAGSGSLWQRR